MQSFPLVRAVRAVILLGVLAVTACDVPNDRYVPSEPELSTVATATLLSCPSSDARAARGLVLPLGGVVSLGRNSVLVPLGAILGMTRIEIEVPASEHMLVELHANGHEHWQFLAPLTVTIDYSRCDVGLFDAPVTVYHVDPETGELLEHMGGIDNRLTRTITFVTDHFSGYAIAN